MTLSTDDRLAALERRVTDLAFECDVERLRRETLERSIAELRDRRLEVRDLPIAALLRRIEQLGDFDAALLLRPGTVSDDLLAPKVAA